ncbi:MAG TPA: D-glycero-beta-D-manno-heptose 1-phosphate adenylyltransferase [Nitrospiria bacterium]|jgi:D-beta-D-heptose 7-phosphate kinase/D-beta-D-heptose 1-phosphate adenosyltransferase|nr:D-glycero-beta-D-manno-heptose 1-phosphate adenylyltransferase [Nitrospiria bacterium]
MTRSSFRVRSSPRSKVKTVRQLKTILGRLRKRGERIVFTNGCFDLLHIGHLRYLQRARRQGDRLVVGINSDRSVRAIKGPPRPLLPQAERAELLAALSCVDYVTIFSEPDPLAVITALQPDVLIKGSDWGHNKIIGREAVERRGGRVRRVPLVKGVSTTRLIEKILKL